MLGVGRLGRGGGDFIIKPIFGSRGHGIVRISDPDVAYRVLRSLEQVRAVFYVQRAVDHGARDVRAFVHGGTTIGSNQRRATAPTCRPNLGTCAASTSRSRAQSRVSPVSSH